MRIILIIGLLVLSRSARTDSPEPVKAAIAKGLRRIEQGSANYPKNRQCFSCHHQAMPILSMTLARKRGFDVAREKIKQRLDFSLKSLPKKEVIVKGQGIGGSNTTVVYALSAFAQADHPPDETTTALLQFLLVRQGRDGSWPAVTKRPPSEGSAFTNTALALYSLKKYGRAKAVPDTVAKAAEAAFQRGKDWLGKNQPVTMEDKVFRLRGLIYSGADAKEIAAARALLLKEQQVDGSWAQLAGLKGDAYATGAAMVSLRASGLDTGASAFARGVKFLLATQKQDGSWIVPTRSKPIQTFFDNGDPGGAAQFISFTATNWAVLGLLETLSTSPIDTP